MNLANRQFKNNLTGDIVRVIDSFESIAILDDKSKSSTAVLLNPNLYTEINESFTTKQVIEDEVDVNNFFGNQYAYNSLADKIKNIPPDQMGNIDESQVMVNMSSQPQPSSFIPQTNENIVYETSEEDEKEALARKYGVVTTDVNSLSKQNEAFSKILGDDTELPAVPQIFTQTIEPDKEIVQRIDVKRELPIEVEIPQIEDPIIKMFKGVKRNVSFNINIELSDRIPRVDFIEMMEDSYETSIIEFLANEFTEKILSDPEAIKAIIKDRIKKMVYSSDWASSDMDKLKAPTIKGTLNVKKQVQLDVESTDVDNVEISKEKKKRVYKKKSEVTND